MVQYFYVLFNKEMSAFYLEDPNGFILYSEDLLRAEHYHTEQEAKNILKYFKKPENWTVKKVTMSIDL